MAPPYHISRGCSRAGRGRFTKFHDFVPFGICQDPVKLLLTFFIKKFEKSDFENFWGSSSFSRKWKKIKKIFFDETQNLESLWSQDLTHKIWVKSETKNFFFQRGDPLVFFWFSKNHQRVPPLNREKFFVSDSTQILCVKSLGHKDCMFWISSKSETKIFFISKGGTLWCFSDFQGLNVKMLNDIYGHKWRDRLPWMLK